MNAAFLKVNKKWINLDRVLVVEEREEEGSGNPIYVIHFTDGKSETIPRHRALEEYLTKSPFAHFSKTS